VRDSRWAQCAPQDQRSVRRRT